MKTYGGLEVSRPSALDGGEWAASRLVSRCPLYRKLGGPHSRSGGCGVETGFLPFTGNQTRTVQNVSGHYSDLA
jgi:hypothetical protein